ncbi:MAG: exlusion protein FxsA [Alphaproteobacteria bacterium HGW-Alphaproteobacteria-8]|jgi:UPF0716 protein FxsA|nr:MAG: exlusion protein FxsA [Alphaproteobacteria bacterium HGW-Alphaproteobacteria-8]
MALLLMLLTVPLIEIALFVTVGGAIGLGPTLLIVAVTAIVGAAMLRRQGVAALGALQTAMERGEDPAGPLAEGALLVLGAVLLLTPGFFTDTLGFALLFPTVRRALIGWLGPLIAARAQRAERRPTDTAPIEAEYRDVTESAAPKAEDRREQP